MKKIVIFASGSGTNAENIIQHFQEIDDVCISYVLSNKKDAKVHDRAKKHGITSLYFNKEVFLADNGIINLLKKEADIIVLAGFLWKVPEHIVCAFPNRILNIHPALLPKYGGKGMYGSHVHRAVIENKEKESGITIHYVNEKYDEGAILFQASVTIEEKDTPESLAKKIHQLEHKHFPEVIASVIEKL